MLRERNMLDPDRLPQPRHVRLRMVDETKHPLTPLTCLEAEHRALIAVNAERGPTDFGLSLWVDRVRALDDRQP